MSRSRTTYVICRLEPDAQSGCVYWAGGTAVHTESGEKPTITVHTAGSAAEALVIDDEDAANGWATWLNMGWLRAARPPEHLWQALPLTIRAPRGYEPTAPGAR